MVPQPTPTAPAPAVRSQLVEFARLVRPVDAKERITELEFPTDEVRVEMLEVGGKRQLFAIIQGRLKAKETSLLRDTTPIPKTMPQGDFRYEFKLEDKASPLKLTAVAGHGNVKIEKIQLEFPLYAEYMAGRPATPKLLGLTVGVGVSYLSYTDSRPSSNLTEIGITPKVAFNRSFFSPRLDFGANAFITALTVAGSQAVTMRLFGANARVGYVLPRPREPWRLALYTGYYFTTMFVSPALFGFTQMHGPQLFPTARYTFRNQSSISFYFKYSPVFGSGGVLSLSNAEMAIGTAYALPLGNRHPLAISLDVARLNLIDLEGAGINAALNSVTLGASYGF